MTDEQQAKEVEAILAGKTPKRECVVCRKAQTTKRCHICDGLAVCQNCRGDHRDRHYDVHELPCTVCGAPTGSRCSGCARPVCDKWETEISKATKRKSLVFRCIEGHRAARPICKSRVVRRTRLNRPRLDILEEQKVA